MRYLPLAMTIMLALLLQIPVAESSAAPFMVTINVDASNSAGELKPGLGTRALRKVTQWRVDQANGNAFGACKAMGAPKSPNFRQYQTLAEASAMKPAVLAPLAFSHGAASLSLALPRQGVTPLVID